MFKIKNKSRQLLGVAKGTRRYDLPLNKGAGGTFLKILVGLMTFLAMLALAASFALSAMTDRWSSGLENKASIEIPAEDNNGAILTPEQMGRLGDQVYNFVKSHPAVENVVRMQEEEIIELVSPWLGENLSFDNIPLPTILSISFKKKVAFDEKALEARLQTIAPQAKLDTHKGWLKDVLKFTGALHFAAVLITIVIGITTIIAVAGAVQSRMTIYYEELELLHLMGASDRYIARQLQRYMLLLSFQGALIGALVGGVILWIIGWLSGKMDISLLPDFTLNSVQLGFLLVLPLFIALLAMVTAKQTVLRVLQKMP